MNEHRHSKSIEQVPVAHLAPCFVQGLGHAISIHGRSHECSLAFEVQTQFLGHPFDRTCLQHVLETGSVHDWSLGDAGYHVLRVAKEVLAGAYSQEQIDPAHSQSINMPVELLEARFGRGNITVRALTPDANALPQEIQFDLMVSGR
jgi:hypothetical protein